MRPLVTALVISAGFIALGRSPSIKPSAKPVGDGQPVLWRQPADLATRNLFYGSGGQAHELHGGLTFVKEDTTGASPKFEAVDEEGTHWKVKLGIEARPESAASRLLWAAGYFASEDYFLPQVRVNNLPHHLHRGNRYITSDGIAHDVRVKRHSAGQKKLGIWSWANNPFSNTREWNGLRVMMAVLNNWDLKDDNNAIYQIEGASPEQHYLVSDLGATFGTPGLSRTLKGDLKSYEASGFVRSTSGDRVDFTVPSGPPAGYVFALPILVQRLDLVWIGRGIPRADARWVGDLLAKLSPSQIRDAFRAAGYSDAEIERFARVIEHRIQELQRL
jgi:hypothetical protein